MRPDMVREKHPRAEAAITRWEEGKNDPERLQAERDWSDIARLMRPQRGDFANDPTDRDLEKPLSSGPIMAQQAKAAGIYAAITNPANRWFGMETPDRDLNRWQPMAEWNDLVTARVLASFRPSISSFYSASFQAYSDISAFGNAAGYDEIDEVDRKFIDVSLSLSEVVVWVDFHGRVTEVVRKFLITGRQAAGYFGLSALPARIQDAAAKGEDEKFTFYHHVLKNDDYKGGRRKKLGHAGKPWLSVYASEEGRALVRLRGYEEMPFYFPRWDVDSGRKYGTGSGFIALASARVHAQMTAAGIRQAQFAADNVVLAPDPEAFPLNGVIRPGEVLYGAVDGRGRELVRSLDNFGSIGITDAEKAKLLEEIKDVFHYSIMGLTGRTGITEEETRIMEEARLRNWAPHADRIMEEYAARKVERRFRMLWRAGQIPPPPKEAEGLPLQVRYQSAATMALRAREGMAVRQFGIDLGGLAQLSPRLAERAADRINPDELIEALHDASASLPAAILNSREEADKMAQARAQAAQAQAAMQAMQAGGGIARDLAQAGLPLDKMLGLPGGDLGGAGGDAVNGAGGDA